MPPGLLASGARQSQRQTPMLQRPSESGDDLQTSASYVIRSLPRIHLGVISPSTLIKSGVDLAVLMIDKAVHEEVGFQIEGLPVLGVPGELVGVFKCDHCFALLPPLHVAVACRF